MGQPKRVQTELPEATAPRGALPIVLLVVAVVAAYATSFAGDFVFDDYKHIVANESIRDLTRLDRALIETRRPVVVLTLAANYAVGGLNPFVYHLTNLVIHGAAAVVLFALLRRLLRIVDPEGLPGSWREPLALAAAIVWAVHPLQTQSVTYIIQRGESLMGLCYLLTLYAAVRSADVRGGRWWGVLAVAACAVGMGTKAVMVTAPVAVVLLDWVFLRRDVGVMLRSRWLLYAGLFATWLVLAMVGVLEGVLDPNPDGARAVGFGYTGVSPLEYLRTQPLVILHYLRLVVVPYPLVLDYAWPVATNMAAISAGAVVIGGLVVASLYGLAWRRWWGFAGVLFFLVLLPTSSFVPIKDLAFEHRMYVSLAGVVSVVVFGAGGLLARVTRGHAQRHLRARQRLLMGLGAVATVFAVLTALRNLDYRSATVMWADIAEKRPQNARAWSGLGTARAMAGDRRGAIEAFKRAVALNPAEASTRANFGKALLDLGRPADAVVQIEQAIALSEAPKAEFHNSLGNAYRVLGNRAGAEEAYRAAIAIEPESATYYFNLAAILAQAGDYGAAAAQFEQLLRVEPGNTAARLALAELYAAQGDAEATEAAYEAALGAAPDDYAAHFQYGTWLLRAGRAAEAREALTRAITLRPTSADALTNRGNAALLQNDGDAALRDFSAALRVAPHHRIARLQRAAVHERLGNRAEARADLRVILARNPGDREAQTALRRLGG